MNGFLMPTRNSIRKGGFKELIDLITSKRLI